MLTACVVGQSEAEEPDDELEDEESPEELDFDVLPEAESLAELDFEGSSVDFEDSPEPSPFVSPARFFLPPRP